MKYYLFVFDVFDGLWTGSMILLLLTPNLGNVRWS